MADKRQTVIGASVMVVVGAFTILVVASPIVFASLLIAWVAWQIRTLVSSRVTTLLPALVAVLAVALGTALYPPGRFAMYSIDALEVVGRLDSSQWHHLLVRLVGPASAPLLATEGWQLSARILTAGLAISTLCWFYASATRAVGTGRIALVMSALVAASPTFLRLSTEAPAPLLVSTLALAALLDSQRFAESGAWPDLARSLLGTILASYLLSGLVLLPLVAALHWFAWRHRARVAWPVIVLAQFGLVATLVPAASATLMPAVHASATGILWHHQFIHPVFAILGAVGFLGLLAARPAAACTAAVAAMVAVTAEQWGLDTLIAATLLFPLSWLTIGAGVATLDARLHQGRALIYLSLGFLVIHHQWLFHGLFGRVLG